VKHLRLVATVVLSTFIACSLVSTGFAQQPAATPTPTPVVTTTLKVTIVISRFNGDKKVGSLPFVLMVVPANDSTILQMGGSVPLYMSTSVDKDTKAVTSSWTYQSVGTRITATAGRGVNEAGQYSLNLNVDDSQLASETSDAGSNTGSRPGRMQNFTSSSRLLLRDGQTVQYIAATDKISGEVAKLDVTLNVIK
jgi:hypothetical protein